MANLRIGSSGDEVKKLQNALISAGYNVGSTGADGVFGKNTDAAVREYQRKNQLAVDGIAGQNTLGMLYGAGTTATGTGNTSATSVNPSAPVTSQAGFTYGDFQYEDFKPSDAIQQANALLQQQQANKPGAWTDPHQDKWMEYLSQYENRGPFSYDVNSDALYQQYKDQYIQQGQLAMMDTMGQAAAMTGGYGNSYAQSVGQQAYNQQLGKLNEVVPELYGMAYDRYQQDGQKLLDQYSLYKGLSDQSYAQHQDTVDNWYREMTRLTDDYNTQYSREYEDYLRGYNTALDEYNTDRQESFSNRSDLVNLITSTGYKPTDAELEAAGMTRSQADAYATTATTSKVSETKYTVLDYEEQKKWEKDFDKAESLEDIDRIADRMEQAGVDPQIVASWRDSYAEKFEEKDPHDDDETGKPPLTKLPYTHTPGRGGKWDVDMKLR